MGNQSSVTKAQDLEERRKLKCYKFGQQLGDDELSQLAIKDINLVNVAVIGPSGSGKSCFIGTSEMAIGPKTRGTTLQQASGLQGTIFIERFLYDCKVKFHLVDVRGLFKFDEGEYNVIKKLLYDTLNEQCGKEVLFENAAEPTVHQGELYQQLRDKVHAVIVVLNLRDPRMKSAYNKHFEKLRRLFRNIGMTPVTVLTHEDELKSEAQSLDELKRQAAQITGSPLEWVLPIANYRSGHMDVSYERNKKVYEIIWNTLQSAERYVKIQKQRQATAKKNENS